MKEPAILSVPSHAASPVVAPAVAGRARPKPFDACHAGVVLRAVLFVEAVVGVAVLFPASGPGDWAERLAVATGGVLPATLAWLVATCGLKNVMVRLPVAGQQALGALLGALAGAAACGVLALALPGGSSAPWLGSALAGALLAQLAVAALALRARGQTPAAMTARLAELQARIRPHFLFNTLNSAIALVRAEPMRAETLLEDLAELFRHALVDQGETTTLASELDMARRYLAVEEVRFGNRLRVEWILDPAADGALLPPLLLQPLVENAILHGVERNPEVGRVRVVTERRPTAVIVKITNTLPPPNAAAGTADGSAARHGNGIALENVRSRLALLYDLEASFRAERRGDLFHVRIRLPA
ncbi:MAG: histidine kinase [Pseudomonadota bacterium]